MSIKEITSPTNIDFHFDPACPLAWRTALWVREARKVRPLHVNWRFFSLEVVNRAEGAKPDYKHDGSWASMRVLALARRQGGNEAVERLYLSLGTLLHWLKESIKDYAIIQDALQKADLDPALLGAALEDETTIEDVLADHQEAVRRYRAFGVPTIAIEGLDVGFYGPIIHSVPHDEEAGELWDYTAWALRQPNLFELKRDRRAVSWGPVSA
jgi:predicted DsbA family dithiol-disulfide isomerase